MNGAGGRKKRAVVFAYSSIGHECLAELLASGLDIVALFTHEDDPGEEKWFLSVRSLADKSSIPVRVCEKLGEEDARFIRELHPDLIFSFSLLTCFCGAGSWAPRPRVFSRCSP